LNGALSPFACAQCRPQPSRRGSIAMLFSPAVRGRTVDQRLPCSLSPIRNIGKSPGILEPAHHEQALENSPSGLWRTPGTRVGLTPSGVQIPHSPHSLRGQNASVFGPGHSAFHPSNLAAHGQNVTPPALSARPPLCCPLAQGRTRGATVQDVRGSVALRGSLHPGGSANSCRHSSWSLPARH
jgi:hypothetical protein